MRKTLRQRQASEFQMWFVKACSDRQQTGVSELLSPSPPKNITIQWSAAASAHHFGEQTTEFFFL